MPRSPIGDSHEDVLREEIERDPTFASIQEETHFEGQVGLALANMREQRDLTQRALGELAGMPHSMVNRIEKAGQIPTITTLWKLARALNAEATIRPEGITIRPALPLPAAFSAPESSHILDFWKVSALDISSWAPNSLHTTPLPPVVTIYTRPFSHQEPEETAKHLDINAVQRFLSPSSSNEAPTTPLPRDARRREDQQAALGAFGGQ